MAYDEQLAARVRDMINERPGVVERKMFGGLGWMVGGNMACAVMRDGLIIRIAPEEVEEACRGPHVDRFGHAGSRPMRGFVRVDAEALAGDAELARWIDRGAERAASLPPK